MFGGVSFGYASFGSPPLVDASSPGPYDLLSPDSFFGHAVQLNPYDPDVPGIRQVVLLDRDILRDDSIDAKVRLIKALQFTASITSGSEESGIGGVGSETIGNIEIAGHVEGWDFEPYDRKQFDLEALRDYFWDGRSFTVFRGDDSLTVSQFKTVFSGKTLDILASETGFQLVIAPLSTGLDDPVQPNRYAGTGGLEGFETLKDRPKPLAWGLIENANALLIDRGEDNDSPVYQLNDGAIEAVLGVYDRGAPYTFQGDTTNIYDSPPNAGFYKTDLSKGVVRLGVFPAAVPTFDFKGANTGGYVDRPGAICKVIAQSFLSDSEIDFPSFSKLDRDVPRAIGLYLPNPTQNARAVIDRIVADRQQTGVLLGYRTVNKSGQVKIGQVGFTAPSATIYGEQILAMRRAQTQVPINKVDVGYRRSYVVQGEEALATIPEADGGPSDERREFVGEQYRRTEAEDATVETEHPLAQALIKNTLMTSEVDAIAERDKVLALVKVKRVAYEIKVRDHQFEISAGDTVRLEDDDVWNVNGEFIVRTITENTQEGLTTLVLWG